MAGNGPVFQRRKRKGLDTCLVCGRKLNAYNTTGQCWCHGVEDPEQNATWTPGRTGVGYGDGAKISEWHTTSISAGAGRWK